MFRCRLFTICMLTSLLSDCAGLRGRRRGQTRGNSYGNYASDGMPPQEDAGAVAVQPGPVAGPSGLPPIQLMPPIALTYLMYGLQTGNIVNVPVYTFIRSRPPP
ncbi:unnamed protein product [Soboliphyme baturini]|uniref:Secreted protein n=1 Tax=Soboliphyme baturini TaxID=241478 RepID=A0A183IZ18_9BILA|nr:unnamed protein product [Soboliphyme baturini]